MKQIIGYGLILLVLTGCVGTPEKMKMLEEQNLALTTDLTATKGRVADLEKDKANLEARVDDLTKIAAALEKEKGVREEEAGKLRQDVRSFLKDQISTLRTFSKNQSFLDYVGGELMTRLEQEGENLTLIDLNHRIPSGGSLIGTWGYFTAPCSYQVFVMRKVEEGWFAVWQAGPFQVTQPGLNKMEFQVPFSVAEGDTVAYAFEGPVAVPYNRGTGETLYTEEKVTMGGRFMIADLDGKDDRRTYSIGVVGLLE